MYKPVRPKSAKGKTRSIRITHQQRNDETAIQPSSRYKPTNETRLRRSSTKSKEQPSSSVFESNSRESLIPPSSKPPTKTPEPENFPDITRPVSSLSKYPILPRISTPSTSNPAHSHLDAYHSDMSDMTLLTHQAQQMILDCSTNQQQAVSNIEQFPPKKPSPPFSNTNKRKGIKGNVEGMDVNKRKKIYQTQSVFAHSQQTTNKRLSERPKIPREPKPNEERLLIAIKLPDGQRIERYFSPTTTTEQVLMFAHSRFSIIPLALCTICRMDTIPKTVIDDLSLTLQQLEIKNRTVLYIEEKDE